VDAQAKALYDSINAEFETAPSAPPSAPPPEEESIVDADAAALYDSINAEFEAAPAPAAEPVLPRELTTPRQEDIPELVEEAASTVADVLVPGFKVARGVRSGIGMMRTMLGQVPVEEFLPDLTLRNLDEDYTDSMRRDKTHRPSRETLQQLVFAAEQGVDPDSVDEAYYERWKVDGGSDDVEFQQRIKSGKYRAEYSPSAPGVPPELKSVTNPATGERFDPSNQDPEYRKQWGVTGPGWSNIELTNDRLTNAIGVANDRALQYALTRDKAMEFLDSVPQSMRWNISVQNDPYSFQSWFDDANPFNMSEPHLVASHNMAGLARYLHAAGTVGIGGATGAGTASAAGAIKQHARGRAKWQTQREMEPWYKEHKKRRQEEGFFGALVDRPWDLAPNFTRGMLQTGAGLAMGARWVVRTASPVIGWAIDPSKGLNDLEEPLGKTAEIGWGGLKTAGAGFYHVGASVSEWAQHLVGIADLRPPGLLDAYRRAGVEPPPPEEYLGSAGAYLFEEPADLAGLIAFGGGGFKMGATRMARQLATQQSALIDARITALGRNATKAQMRPLAALAEKIGEASRRTEIAIRVGNALQKYADPLEVMARGGRHLPRWMWTRLANKDTILSEVKLVSESGEEFTLLDAMRDHDRDLYNRHMAVKNKGTGEVIPEGWTRDKFMEKVQDVIDRVRGENTSELWIHLPGEEAVGLNPVIPEPDVAAIVGRELTEDESSSIRNMGKAAHKAMNDRVERSLDTLEMTSGVQLRSIVGDFKNLAPHERDFLIDLADQIDPLMETARTGALAAAEQTKAISNMRPLLNQRGKATKKREALRKRLTIKLADPKGVFTKDQKTLAWALMSRLSEFDPGWTPRRIGSVTLDEFDEFVGILGEDIRAIAPGDKRKPGLRRDLREVIAADRKLIEIEEGIAGLLEHQVVKSRVLKEGELYDAAHLREAMKGVDMSVNEREAVSQLIDQYQSAVHIVANLKSVKETPSLAASANVARASLDWSVGPANEARPWFLTKEDVMALDDDRFVSIFGDTRSDDPQMSGRLFEHDESIKYAAETGEYVPLVVREQYRDIFIEKSELDMTYIARDALMERIQRKITAFPSEVLDRRKLAQQGRVAKQMVDTIYEDLRDAMVTLKKRHQDLHTAKASNAQRVLASEVLDKAIRTGGDGDRAKLAALLANGVIPRAIPAKHLAEAQALKILRDVEEGASKQDWGLLSNADGSIRKHLEGLGISLDTNISPEIQNYYDFIMRKYGGANLDNAVAVYTTRPMNMLEDLHVVQHDAVSKYASDIKTEAIRAGAAAVREGLMSKQTYILNILDYFPDKYIQHEDLFKAFIGEGSLDQLQEFIDGKTKSITDSGGKKIYGKNFQRAEYRHRDKEWKAEMGRIEDPQWVFLQGYNRIWNDIMTAKLLNRLKASKLKSTGQPLAVAPKTYTQRGVVKEVLGGDRRARPEGVPDDWRQLPGRAVDSGFAPVMAGGRGGGNRGYGALGGHWVPPDLHHELTRMRNIPTTVGRWYNKYVRFWKVGHTALNPATQLVNWSSNIIISDMVGLNPATSASAMKAYGGTWDEAWMHEGWAFEEAMIGGLFGKDYLSVETNALISKKWGDVGAPDVDFKAGGFDEFAFAATDIFVRGKLLKGSWGMGKAGYNLGVRSYTFGDEFFKLWRFKQVRVLQKEFAKTGTLTYDMKQALGGRDKALAILDVADEDAAVRLAVENVFESGFFDYSNVSAAIGWGRQWYAPFITFSYKAFPFMTKYMAERPIKAAFYRQLYEVMGQTTATMDGDISEEKQKEIELARSSLPNWAQGNTIYEGTNTITAADGSQAQAHSFYDVGRFTPMSGQARRDEAYGDQLIPSEFAPNGLLWSFAGAFAFNRDPRDLQGRDLITVGAGRTKTDQVIQFLNAARLSQLPDWLGGRGWDKAAAWYNDKPYNARGRVYTLSELIADGFGGSRRYDVLDSSRLERLRDYQMRGASQPQTSEEYNTSRLYPDAWNEMRNRFKKNVEDQYEAERFKRDVKMQRAIEKNEAYKNLEKQLFGD